MAAKQNKVIVTCAVTGSIHTPSMSPYLPVTAAQIEEAAVGAAEAGAAIVHLHARDPNTGQPSQDPRLFMEFLPNIKARSDVVVNLTTGAAGYGSKSGTSMSAPHVSGALALVMER